MEQLSILEHLGKGGGERVSLRGRYSDSQSRAPAKFSARSLLDHYRGYRVELKALSVKSVLFEKEMSGRGNHTFVRDPLRPSEKLEHLELRLEAWVDGEYSHFVRMSFSDSGTSSLSHASTIEFRHSLVLRLIPEKINAPPRVTVSLIRKMNAEETLNSPKTGTGKINFDIINGEISLNYRVSRYAGLPLSAHELIQEFQSRKTRGVWSNITRTDLAKELKTRIDRPESVYQGPTALCGPSAVIYAMALKSPRRYVTALIQLFERGAFKTKFGRVTASSSLRNSPLPSVQTRKGVNTIPGADWMLAAALRNDENLFLKVEGGSELAGATAGWAIQTWLRELLGYEKIRTHSAAILGKYGITFRPLGNKLGIAKWMDVITGVSPLEALRSGANVLRSGGVSLMLIDSPLIKDHPHLVAGKLRLPDPESSDKEKSFSFDYSKSSDKEKGFSFDYKSEKKQIEDLIPNISNHWVTLWEDPAHIIINHDGKRVTFGCFSWRAYYLVDVPLSKFDRKMFLIITAEQS